MCIRDRSCGACEIEVNGNTLRACIATVPASKSGAIEVELSSDPYCCLLYTSPSPRD